MLDRDVLGALARHLSGTDFRTPRSHLVTVVIEEDADPPPLPFAASATPDVVFAPDGVAAALPVVGACVSCTGRIGRDGDELVVADELVVESVGLSQLRFQSGLAPAFVVVESGADAEELLDVAAGFRADGHVPELLDGPSVALELGAFLGPLHCGCRERHRDRLTVRAEPDGARLSTSPNGRPLGDVAGIPVAGDGLCPVCLPEAAAALDVTPVTALAGALVARRRLLALGARSITVSGAGWWIEDALREAGGGPPRVPVVLTASDLGAIALNLQDLKLYRVSEDAARVLELAMCPEPQLAAEVAQRKGLGAHEFDVASSVVLDQLGVIASAP
jgi:hypothetical protein